MLVKDLMTTEVITISPEAPVEEAYGLMKKHDIRRLPVVGLEGTLLGIVTDRDVRQVLIPWRSTIRRGEKDFYYLAGDKDVEDIMTREVITIGPEARVTEAARILHQHKFGGLPVVDQAGKVIGILTAVDLLSLLINKI